MRHCDPATAMCIYIYIVDIVDILVGSLRLDILLWLFYITLGSGNGFGSGGQDFVGRPVPLRGLQSSLPTHRRGHAHRRTRLSRCVLFMYHVDYYIMIVGQHLRMRDKADKADDHRCLTLTYIMMILVSFSPTAPVAAVIHPTMSISRKCRTGSPLGHSGHGRQLRLPSYEISGHQISRRIHPSLRL